MPKRCSGFSHAGSDQEAASCFERVWAAIGTGGPRILRSGRVLNGSLAGGPSELPSFLNRPLRAMSF